MKKLWAVSIPSGRSLWSRGIVGTSAIFVTNLFWTWPREPWCEAGWTEHLRLNSLSSKIVRPFQKFARFDKIALLPASSGSFPCDLLPHSKSFPTWGVWWTPKCRVTYTCPYPKVEPPTLKHQSRYKFKMLAQFSGWISKWFSSVHDFMMACGLLSGSN